MKRNSIITKITIWYTVFILVIAVILVTIVEFSWAGNAADAAQKLQAQSLVPHAIDFFQRAGNQAGNAVRMKLHNTFLHFHIGVQFYSLYYHSCDSNSSRVCCIPRHVCQFYVSILFWGLTEWKPADIITITDIQIRNYFGITKKAGIENQ